jgi:hypothetical protein
MHNVLLNLAKACSLRSANVHIPIIGLLKLDFRIKIWTGASVIEAGYAQNPEK